jgi:hypothetical protein
MSLIMHGLAPDFFSGNCNTGGEHWCRGHRNNSI